MIKTWVSILIIPLLISCNSIDTETPRNKVDTDVNGVAALGNFNSGIITAYSFSDCSIGDKLAEVELVDTNQFNLTVSTGESDLPVLLKMSKFSYREESSQTDVLNVENALYASFVLQSGGSQNVSISYWTNLAHARTTFLCGEDAQQVTQHIIDSNTEVSTTLLFDIINTLPRQVQYNPIIVTNLPATSYGVANSAVSFLTANMDRQAGGSGDHSLISSIDFISMTFDDLASDNILDGFGATGGLSLGGIAISADTYRTDLPSEIHYVLALLDITPTSRIEDISVIANLINLSENFDVFPAMDVTPINEEVLPTIVDTSYWTCARYDSCSPVVGCNVCFTIEGNDRFVPCEITMFLDIQDSREIPFTVTGKVLGAPVDAFEEVSIGGHSEPTFHIKFPYNTGGNQRDIQFNVSNDYGLSRTFNVNANARLPVPSGVGQTWYNQPFVCDVSVTSVN